MTNPKHTDTRSSGELVKWLRDEDSYYRLQEKHWCIDYEELERQRLAAADRIEQLEEVLRIIATDGLHTPSKNVSLARAALGEKQ